MPEGTTRLISHIPEVQSAITRLRRALDAAAADTGYGQVGLIVTLKNHRVHEIEHINHATERHHATGR